MNEKYPLLGIVWLNSLMLLCEKLQLRRKSRPEHSSKQSTALNNY